MSEIETETAPFTDTTRQRFLSAGGDLQRLLVDYLGRVAALTGTDEDLEALSAWNEELRSAALAFDDATFDHTEIFPLLIEDFEPDEED